MIVHEVSRGPSGAGVVAGGSKTDDLTTLELIEGSMQGGAAGLSIGRNAFQHANPASFVRACAKIVHDGMSAAEVHEMLKGGML